MAQLRGGTPILDNGRLFELPLDLQTMALFLAADWWKLSFNMPTGEQIRIVKEADGTLRPTIWDDTAQMYRPLLPHDPLLKEAREYQARPVVQNPTQPHVTTIGAGVLIPAAEHSTLAACSEMAAYKRLNIQRAGRLQRRITGPGEPHLAMQRDRELAIVRPEDSQGAAIDKLKDAWQAMYGNVDVYVGTATRSAMLRELQDVDEPISVVVPTTDPRPDHLL